MTENNSNDETNYFVCTLGEAAVYNAKCPHQFTTVNEFVDHQSTRIPNQPAVVFPIPSQKCQEVREWDHELFSVLVYIIDVVTTLTTLKRLVIYADNPFTLPKPSRTRSQASTQAMAGRRAGVQ